MFWKKSKNSTFKNAIALDLIKKYEGCELKAYQCPASKWSIGYGCTVYENGTPVTPGDKITQARAEQLLEDYLLKNVYPHIDGMGFTENQTAALASLIYNIGWPAFSKSQCWKAIKKKDWAEAFLNWDWISAGKKPLKGLIKRRAEEVALFMKDI